MGESLYANPQHALYEGGYLPPREVLQIFGWSEEEAEEAYALGYTLPFTLKQIRALLFELSTRAREVTRISFQRWLIHHYEQSKAALLGLSLPEFIALWRRLRSMEFQIFEEENCDEWILPSQLLVYYMRARRAGLSEVESLSAIELGKSGFKIYVALRRRLSQALVWSILGAWKRSPNRWDLINYTNDVFKVLRRGGKIPQLLRRIEEGTLTHIVRKSSP